ncbi:type III secretion system chaperone [Pseudothauera rhizosphaerae]|uniref:Type III secretion system chaperone n=1 Tax=Pseudothauera rhizosphaerae TaxID=2565932 RepID=A0A4S4AXR6_9RHOO|nr:type III secretion system chaperone [Pseudothauera rhizosphaerae]THF64108.1 type III secretion system chaperone [Pseudothauera rhizosphaerae]
MFENLVTALCVHLGLAAPAGELDGAFYLQVGQLEIGLLEEPENDSLILECTVGNLGADQWPQQFQELCEANYYWSATNGATLGYNAASGDVVLTREWALQVLDSVKLAQLVEKFVVAAEFWNTRLDGRAQAPAAEPADALATMIRA